MLTIYHRAKKSKDLEHRKITQIISGSWVHLEDPTQLELDRLVKEAGLNAGLLSDACDPHEVPRVEKEGSAVYFYTRVPKKSGSDFITAVLTVIVTPNLIVTISEANLPIWEPFKDTSVDFLTTQKTTLFFLFFREVNKSYQRFLNYIRRDVQKTTVRLQSISNQDIVNFVRFERALNEFMSALLPTNSAMDSLLSNKMLKLYEDDSDLIEDLSLSNGQLLASCESILKTIVNVREAYSTIMTNKLNQTIKQLTALTIVLTVPTMIASFFGMNVELPFGGEWVFWFILVVSLVISVVLLYVFLREKN